MMRVTPAPEPDTFDEKVRQPGLLILMSEMSSSPTPFAFSLMNDENE